MFLEISRRKLTEGLDIPVRRASLNLLLVRLNLWFPPPIPRSYSHIAQQRRWNDHSARYRYYIILLLNIAGIGSVSTGGSITGEVCPPTLCPVLFDERRAMPLGRGM